MRYFEKNYIFAARFEKCIKLRHQEDSSSEKATPTEQNSMSLVSLPVATVEIR